MNDNEWEIPEACHSHSWVDTTAPNELLASGVEPFVGDCTHDTRTRTLKPHALPAGIVGFDVPLDTGG